MSDMTLRPRHLTTWHPLAPRLLDDFLDTGIPRTTTSTTVSPPYALGYLDIGTKAYRLLGNFVGFHSSHNFCDASTITTVVGISVCSAFGFFSSLTICVTTL